MKADVLETLIREGRWSLSWSHCAYSLTLDEWWLVRDPATGDLFVTNVTGDEFGDKREERYPLRETKSRVSPGLWEKLVEILGDEGDLA